MRMTMPLASLLCSACVMAPPPPVMVPVAPPAPVAQQQCREFETSVMIAGRPQPAHGTACLQADGSWRVVQSVADQPPQTYEVLPQVYRSYYPPPYRADPWLYGPPLFLGGVFIAGGWGYHGHGGWHDGRRGGYPRRR